MKNLLRSFVNLKIVTETHSDLALRQYISFTREDAKLNADQLNEFSRSNDRLDDFYFKKMKVSKFSELAFVYKVVFTLSHGQSSVESGFSLNKSVLVDNISNKSIVSRRSIKDHMLSNYLKPHTIVITNKLLLCYYLLKTDVFSRTCFKLIKLGVEFSDLRDDRYNDNFKCESPMCSCGLDDETSVHYFLCSPRYHTQRNNFLSKISELMSSNVSVLPNDHLIHILIYGGNVSNTLPSTKMHNKIFPSLPNLYLFHIERKWEGYNQI